jgi:hypothetical protein
MKETRFLFRFFFFVHLDFVGFKQIDHPYSQGTLVRMGRKCFVVSCCK